MNISNISIEDLKDIESNYILISINHSNSICLPFKEGMRIMNLFEKAEIYKSRYNEDPLIHPISNQINCTLLSRTDYAKIKMQTLLNTENETE